MPPVAAPTVRVVILGSMPGRASLAAGRYYAHPRNAFWPLMAQLLDFQADLPYARRLRALQLAGIGLWDVFAHCERAGSLDAAIRAPVANDFERFLAAHPRVGTLLFNGAKAEQGFRRLVLPRLRSRPSLQRLPSTSPANAAATMEEKRRAWATALAAAGVRVRD